MRQLFELTRWNRTTQQWEVIDRAGSLQKAVSVAESYERKNGLTTMPKDQREYVVIERVA